MSPRRRPDRLQHIAPIGVDRMGALADADPARDYLRLENMDVDIPPDPEVIERTRQAAREDDANSYLPFVGHTRLREAAAAHVSRLSGVEYSAANCLVTAGGLAGILNVLLAVIDTGDEVVVTDPTYAGLVNRIRLAGGVPRFVPLRFSPGRPWAFDRDALAGSIGPRTRAMLLMSPAMPSGAVLNAEDWAAVAHLCVRDDLLLILDSAMERLLFDDLPFIHPAGLPQMRSRTIVVGSASKEFRMIGWRVGWIVAPEAYVSDLAAVCMANGVVPVGIAQQAATIALDRSRTTLQPYVLELQARRDAVLHALDGMPFGVPQGGWSVLLRVRDAGVDGARASAKLLDRGVCATAMTGWGERHGGDYVRFVYANEPVHRLAELGPRVRAALDGSS